jgi:hypothetical protein
MKAVSFFILICFIFIFFACEKEHNEQEVMISENFSDESHKTGRDCMNCHVSGGGGAGWFSVAGSVYNKELTDVQPNGLVQFTSEANGSGVIIEEVEVDERGNFYTTESIDFGDGLFVLVKSSQGKIKYMNGKVTNGACNSCHGSGTEKIWVD